MLLNLHLLRILAAFAVVYYHATSTAGLNLELDVGSYGVDIFFVLSGFIISYIDRGTIVQFLKRRIIRIVPFYWTATLVVFAAAAIAPQFFRSTTADVSHLLHSLLFIPHRNEATGELLPTLVLGWSLNFEVFFYALFAFSMAISNRMAPLLAAGFILLVASILDVNELSSPILSFYSRPVIIEFCFGIAAFYVHKWCLLRAKTLSCSRLFEWVLYCVLIGAVVLIFVLEASYKGVLPRFLVAGVPAFFIVLSAVLLESIFSMKVKSKAAFYLGEASYIVYLIHPYIIFGILRTFFKDVSLSSLELVVTLVLMFLLTGFISVIIHVRMERPFMNYLRSRWMA